MELYTEILSNTENKIQNVIHMADIHIKNSRVEEYKIVFDRLFVSLNQYDKTNTIITIVGDILDEKSLKPSGMDLIAYFFNGLNKLDMPIILIHGNHDLDKTGNIGILKTWFEKFKIYDNVYSLTKTGIYTYNNILFAVSSVFENNNVIPYNSITHLTKDKTTIYLYHGLINKAQINKKFKVESENINVEKNIDNSIKRFADYNYVLLGDIHKHQYLNKEKTIAYCGSLIQQNMGESIDNHGYIYYDIKNNTTNHVHIQNDYAYVTLHIKDNKLQEHKNLPKNLRIRFHIQNTNTVILQETIDYFKKNYSVEDISCFKMDDKNIKLNENISIIDSSTMYDDVVQTYIKDLKTLNTEEKEQLLTLYTKDIGKDNSIPREGKTWRLLQLKFSNLFSYGENNQIDFENFDNIIGFLGRNASGKSSIIDVILFGLYEKTSRSGVLYREAIVNNIGDTMKNFYCELTLGIGDKIYIITRKGYRVAKNIITGTKYNSDVMLSEYNQKTGELSIISSGKQGTNPLIINMFGTYEDTISTTFMLQNQSNNFSSLPVASRRNLLEKICGLDRYDELKDEIKKTSLKKASRLEILKEDLKNKRIYPEHLINLKEDRKTHGLRLKEQQYVTDICILYIEIKAYVKLLNNSEIRKTKKSMQIIYKQAREILDEIKSKIYIDGKINDVINDIYNKLDLKIESLMKSKNNNEDDIILDYDKEKKKYEKILIDLSLTEEHIKTEEENILLVEDIKNHVQLMEMEAKVLQEYSNMLNIEVPRIIIKLILTKIEDIVNTIISSVSSHTIEFNMDEKIAHREINIFVHQAETNKKLLEHCSGSEKFIVDLAIRIAFCSFSRCIKSNCMFIDEGFVSFDAEKLYDSQYLFEIMRQQFNFIVVISHLEQIKNLSTTNYSISKIGLTSKINIIDKTIQNYPSQLEYGKVKIDTEDTKYIGLGNNDTKDIKKDVILTKEPNNEIIITKETKIKKPRNPRPKKLNMN